MMRAMVFIMFFLFAPTLGGIVAHGQTHDEIHEHTKDWHRPSDGMSCCHDNDCRGGVAEKREDGNWWVVIGRDENNRPIWRPAPDNTLMPAHVPPHNGRTIICERNGVIYCVRPAEVKS